MGQTNKNEEIMADEEVKQKLIRLKATRRSHRGVTTKYINEVSDILKNGRLNEHEIESVQNYKKRLELKIRTLESIDRDILEICDVKAIEKEIEESEETSFQVTEITSKIERALAINEQRKERVTRERSPGNSSLFSTSSEKKSYSKLPKLDLQKYNGDLLKFAGFWDRFETAIDNNDEIPTVEKFNYLQYYLEGPAARVIEGLQITEANYVEAKERIRKRFGRKQLTISTITDELIKLKPCSGDKPGQLRYLYDKISISVRGLENMGLSSETHGATWIPIVMGKLPTDVRVQVSRLISREIWSMNELLELLEREVEAREIGEAAKISETTANQTKIHVSSPNNWNRNTRATASVLFNESERNMNIRCIYCKGEHYSASCNKVDDINERKQILKAQGRCFLCLKPNHRVRNCNHTTRNCRRCNKRHHQSICDEITKPENDTRREALASNTRNEPRQITSENTTTSASASSRNETRRVLLQTAKTMAYKEGESTGVPVRILFDNGSQRTYITENLRRKLNLKPIKKETVHVNTFGGENFKKSVCSVVQFSLRGVSDERVELTALSFPTLCTNLPARVDLTQYPHLENLEFADTLNSENEKEPVDILVGSDRYWDLVSGDVIKGTEGPIAVKSKFGWLLSGPVKTPVNDDVNAVSYLCIEERSPLETENDILASELKRFWDTESLGIYEQKENKTHPFLREIHHDGERYEVELPRKGSEPEPLPADLDQALNRLNSLYSRLERDKEVLQEYDNIIEEQLKLGIIEVVPESEQTKEFIEQNETHYLPHFGVTRKDRETTKLRIVFDGSAKSKENNLSLNDYLENGPNFVPPIFDVLAKFRSKPIAMVADIEKAFLQISIDEKDRDVLRFLWYKVSDDKKAPRLLHLRFRRLVFGLKSSPSTLGYVINEHLSKFENSNPDVVKLLKNQLFVDDLAGGANSVKEAFEIFESSKEIMKRGGFNLRKWKSNSPDLMKLIQNDETKSKNDSKTDETSMSVREDDESYAKKALGPQTVAEVNDKAKVLGLNWDMKSDEFYFDFQELIEFANTLPPTKRSVLSLTAKIFDPLGFLTPVTVKLKEMFQVLCVENVNWDDELEVDMRNKFHSIIFEIQRLQDVKLPRCLFETKAAKPTEFEVHGFSDASSAAYAACVYLLTRYDDGTVCVNLIASRSRVSPIKTQTIPRLELLGALILSRLMKSVCQSLESAMDIKLKRYFWVDSCVTLCWIRNERIWTTYVQNRVNEIRAQSLIEEWGYCPGTMNPADMPSRGVKSNELVKSKLWWTGPEFLKLKPKFWPKPPSNSNSTKTAQEEVLKQRGTETHALSVNEKENSEIIAIERFSSKTRLLRTMAWALRFIAKLKAKISKSKLDTEHELYTLTSREIEQAETVILKQVQSESFVAEIEFLKDRKGKPPKLVHDFDLFLDEEGILRCKTRLQKAPVIDTSKRPILLPKKNHFTNLVIRETHDSVAHSGVRMTLSVIRERYWILRGRESVKRVVRNCVLCKWFSERAFATAPSLSLPAFRTDEGPPFVNIGLDFAGPLYIRDSQGNTSKSYICLFTCASTRAVHLELTESLDTESFLRAFRRFTARRGLPKLILSDNAKTFKSASIEIRKIVRSKSVLDYLANRNIEWRFIPERAAWFGSVYERMVGSVKKCLRKIIGRSILRYDELNTLLVEVEGIVNSRPISYVYDDSEGVSYALTPAHLIYGRRITTVPSDTHFEIVSTNQSLTRRARHHRRLLEMFTKLWRRDYLLSLRERVTKKDKLSSNSQIKCGDIVLLLNEKTRRAFWRLARVVEILAGNDGIVRVAKIRVLNNDNRVTILRRSVKHLIPLEVPSNDDAMTTIASNEDVVESRQTAKEGGENQKATRSKRTAAVMGEIVRRLQKT